MLLFFFLPKISCFLFYVCVKNIFTKVLAWKQDIWVEKNILWNEKNKIFWLNRDSTPGPPACETRMLPLSYRDILIIKVKTFDLYTKYKNRAIFDLGSPHSAI